jgi:hypothetical protein
LIPLRSFTNDALKALDDVPQIAHLLLVAILADYQVFEHRNTRIPPIVVGKRQMTSNPSSVLKLLLKNNVPEL